MLQEFRCIVAEDGSNLWVFGGGGSIFRGNGTNWSEMPTVVSQDLNDAVVLGPDDIWVAGNRGVLLQWDGSSWTQHRTDTFVNFHSLAPDGAGGFWLAGENGALVHWTAETAPTPTATATGQPSNTPTRTPTRTPTWTPTRTATPTGQPSHTPTRTPTITPTGQPSSTPTRTPTLIPTQEPTLPPSPTPEPSATTTVEPTGTPVGDPWYRLEMTDRDLRPGDMLLLERSCRCPVGETIPVDEYILLEVAGRYWFWPGWTETPDWSTWALTTGPVHQETILELPWPDGVGEGAGLRFWGGLVRAGTAELVGEIHWVDWSYGG